MSYHDDVFPKKIAYGARGGPQFSTTVMELASGYEKRNINWQRVRARYNVSQGVKEPHQMDELMNYFYARWGRAYSFPFFDHKDHTIKGQDIGVGDGATTEFQIYKRYQSGMFYYDRLLTKIIPNTLKTVMVGGRPLTEDEFSLDIYTGKMTFVEPPPDGHPVHLTEVQFYVHCRFDTDFMDVELTTYEAESWNDINIVEVKEDV